MSGLGDRAKGKAEELKGDAKTGVGKASGDPGLRAEGEADRMRGKGQGLGGRLKTFLARR